MDRHPAVAGQFYPGSHESLRRQVEGFLADAAAAQQDDAVGIIVPHAGYMFSGAIAGAVFAATSVPDKVILLGPNHHGLGHPLALHPEGEWFTPLGRSRVDREFSELIVRHCPDVGVDATAHLQEHSLEVQLPFIQAKNPRATIVPLCLGSASLEQLLELGKALGRVVSAHGSSVLMVASSDMSHYEAQQTAREKDMLALERVTDLDPEGLYRVVKENRISMCGVMPTVVMLEAAREVGARKVRLVRYGHSGEVTGDLHQVVGYAGLTVSGN